KQKALFLYKAFYYIIYLSIILSAFLGIFPKLILLALLSFPLVQKNIAIFMNEQIKEKTFITAIQNSAIIPIFIIIAVGLGIWLEI
ncbi:MAG: 1,4-dihydroxy-2-naphthoate prenyltransferase, partial [Pisciglobus halotolerans]|nr:1,4-dihydroxy-2-naphthoate prenyltransferase [Pisciglobus halotolerans]